MAVTKIWAVTDSVNRVLSYAANPEKTIYSDMSKALHYASDERKTVIGEEKAMYVTGVNCTAETAFAEMNAVQERFDKSVGNVAYHAYQSFKTGEKFNCNEGAYWKLRNISDELCRENGLTVIENPKGKTPRKLYFAEKNGEPTRYNLMREAIDKALTMSTNPKAFTYVMKQLGYVIDLNPYHKYATIRSVNSKKVTRLYRLGEAYDRDAIYDRMRDTLRNNSQEAYRLYYEFTEKKSFGVTIQKTHFVKGNLKTAKKITGLKALYFRYLYLLGVFPKNKKHKPLSPEIREACRFLDRYTQQVQLICDNRLTDISSVKSFIKNTDSDMKLISDYRKMLYRDIDSCHNLDEKAKLIAKRDDCTKALAQLRKDRKTAARIIEDNPKIKENILIEENMRNQYYPLNKQRKRGYER
ncbi:MAG: relaxase/mobilization nuclease domain-containing protein [Firmicutes bacterium]|nr:relaxase/mobilization nuclease domain-containing protein [Bacillota bacterium]